MAHNINIVNEKASIFVVKEPAWHGLGNVLEKCPNSEEAIVKSGLDFPVDKTENYCYIGEKLVKTPSSFSTFRTDTGDILGDRLGKVYKVVQNKDAFTFFDSIVGKGEAIYETAGALGKGETIFISAKLPSYISVKKDDIEKYLLLYMSHDGSGAITAMFTPVRVVCNNTLNAAMRGAGHKVTIRHTGNVEENLANAHKILGITNVLSKQLEEIFGKMSTIKVDDKMLNGYIEQVLIPENRLKEIRAEKAELTAHQTKTIEGVKKYYFEGPGQDTPLTRGTMWGAYNAVTGYFANVKDYKSAEKKMKSLVLGHDYNLMQKSFDLAVMSF